MTDSPTPLVSVCLPSYNGQDFIKSAIVSVLNQSYGLFELVIVDDHSSDRTLDVIGRFADPRIRVIANPSRLGQMGNWNRALGEARGRYVKLLPQDDELRPNCLQRQVECLEKPENGDIALACCAREIIDARGRVILKRSFGKRHGRLAGRLAVRACVRAGTNLIGEPAAVLFRSQAASRAGSFDDRDFYVIDLDYWCRMLQDGNLFVLPEALCAFRVGRQSASFRVAASQDRDFRAFIKRLSGTGRFSLTRRDLLQGRGRALANRLLRQLFYKFVVREA